MTDTQCSRAPIVALTSTFVFSRKSASSRRSDCSHTDRKTAQIDSRPALTPPRPAESGWPPAPHAVTDRSCGLASTERPRRANTVDDVSVGLGVGADARGGTVLGAVTLVAGAFTQVTYIAAMVFQSRADAVGSAAFDPFAPVILGCTWSVRNCCSSTSDTIVMRCLPRVSLT